MNTREVGKKEMLSLDFGHSAFRIGLESVHCNGRWMQLSEDDVRVLYILLSKKFEGVAATDESEPLSMIASWCAAAIQWIKAKESQAANRVAV